MTVRSRVILIGFLMVMGLAAQPPQMASADPSINAAALQGYDPVAYFTEGKAVPGTWVFFVTYRDSMYRFASQENEKLFRADPERYLPQYGGFCAFGMSNNVKLPLDPEAWQIRDGKLFVFLTKDFRDRWLEDPEGRLALSEANWPVLKDTVPKPLEVALQMVEEAEDAR